MTTISVFVPAVAGDSYRAVANGHEATGETLGKVIDSILEQTGQSTGATVVIIHRPGTDKMCDHRTT